MLRVSKKKGETKVIEKVFFQDLWSKEECRNLHEEERKDSILLSSKQQQTTIGEKAVLFE